MTDLDRTLNWLDDRFRRRQAVLALAGVWAMMLIGAVRLVFNV